MKPPIDFKNPNTTSISYDDNPALFNKIHSVGLIILEEASKELIDGENIKTDSQVLLSLISTFVSFLITTHGSVNSLSVLNELSRHIRNSEQYKEESKNRESNLSSSILPFPSKP